MAGGSGAWCIIRNVSKLLSSALEPEGAETESTIVWSVAHAKEDNLLVAARERESLVVTNDAQKSPPVNLLSVSIPSIIPGVTNLSKCGLCTTKTLMNCSGKLSTREVVYYLASADLDDLMSRGRAKATVALRERIQAEAVIKKTWAHGSCLLGWKIFIRR